MQWYWPSHWASPRSDTDSHSSVQLCSPRGSSLLSPDLRPPDTLRLRDSPRHCSWPTQPRGQDHSQSGLVNKQKSLSHDKKVRQLQRYEHLIDNDGDKIAEFETLYKAARFDVANTEYQSWLLYKQQSSDAFDRILEKRIPKNCHWGSERGRIICLQEKSVMIWHLHQWCQLNCRCHTRGAWEDCLYRSRVGHQGIGCGRRQEYPLHCQSLDIFSYRGSKKKFHKLFRRQEGERLSARNNPWILTRLRLFLNP